MGFQESLNIACLSRKTHGFDKKDCVGKGEAVPEIPLEKKMETGGKKGERRKGNRSERSVGANLCSARMEIYGPLIGGVGSRHRGEKMRNGDGT